jgi:hydrophobe/amphiphile efflux-1 (HAE1) family protein
VFCRFFIDRPIFATVLSIAVVLAGGLAVFTLPIAQYPLVTPPTVQVDCNYPGASARVVSQTVAAPIEQQVNGVENMLYMASQSTSDGSYTLTVTFKPGMNLNLAQVLVQNRVALAMPLLPDVVRQTGVQTRKRSPEILLTVSLNSPTGRYDQVYLSNYASLHIKDELARLPGIADVLIFGQRDYSMRIWLDPGKMAVRKITTNDVLAAIRAQNIQVALGQLGQPPAMTGQATQFPLTVLGRLSEPEQFEEIVVKSTPEGRILRLKDIGRAELNARSFDINNRFDSKPTIGLAIFTLPDANALATADAVKRKMLELSQDFPEGCVHEVGYDTTPYIRESVQEVFKSLRDAILLVALVVLLFLQGWRAAVIPLLAVPVAIVGSFAAMAVFGFSLNNLTLFGLVLAIGIVVDDAIVVVEAVEHQIEKGLAPREAAIKAMEQVASPVIAVGCVLSAVFIPCAFISGIVGAFFRQFALTIAVSTLISTFNSLTLSPALAAVLLRPRGARRDPLTWLLDNTLGWLFWLFNRGLGYTGRGYVWGVGKLLRAPSLVFIVYTGLLVLTYVGLDSLPKGFIPTQDKGYLVASVQLPDAAAAERTRDVVSRIEKIALDTEGVKNVNSVAGNSFLLSAYGSNFGSMFIILDPFDKRHSPDLKADMILNRLKERYAAEFPEALINVFPAPAVPGLGRGGGFKIMVEDRGDVGLKTLEEQTNNLIARGNGTKLKPDQKTFEPDVLEVTGLFSVFKANSPQLFIDVDRDACLSQGVNLGDVFGTLQATMGSRYVNDFNRFGRTWQVVVQSDSSFRDDIDDIKRLMVRNNRGQMTPIGSLATIEPISNPLVLTRYNMYPAAAINGNVAVGASTGEANAAMEALARSELPSTMAFEWTELAFLERDSTSTGNWVFLFSVIFVFLVLAALYESWALPLAVILVVPMCVLCSIAGVWVRNMDINVFTQIGFVVLIGLACKNAILIVEFAKHQVDSGVSIREATLAACQLRLRPILMTSLAFVLGVAPLVFANGAGAEMRQALGTAVFGGMLGVTIFGVFLTPVFFYVIEHAAKKWYVAGSPWSRTSAKVLDWVRLRPIRRAGAMAWNRMVSIGDSPRTPSTKK